jgi:hypothetical protein
MKRNLNSTQKLGALALIALTCIIPFETGCTQQQKVTVAQEIVNWTPVFISTADTVNASIEALDPATAIVLSPLTMGINAFGPELQKAAQNYLANPSQTTLQVLQALVTQIQQDASTALLAAAKITNPTSQATATKDINLVATVINTILALVQSISTKAQLAAMATHVHVTLAEVRPYMDASGLLAAKARVTNDLTRSGQFQGELAMNHMPTLNQWYAAEAQAGF